MSYWLNDDSTNWFSFRWFNSYHLMISNSFALMMMLQCFSVIALINSIRCILYQWCCKVLTFLNIKTTFSLKPLTLSDMLVVSWRGCWHVMCRLWRNLSILRYLKRFFPIKPCDTQKDFHLCINYNNINVVMMKPVLIGPKNYFCCNSPKFLTFLPVRCWMFWVSAQFTVEFKTTVSSEKILAIEGAIGC